MILNKLFGKRSDKKSERSSLDLTMADLKPGYFVDYFMKSWEVKKVYLYDWGNNSFSKEYLLDDGSGQVYVHVEEDEKLEIVVSMKTKLSDLSPDVKVHMREYDEPPKTLQYNGEQYDFDSENLAHCKEEDDDDEDYSELVSWQYMDKKEKSILTIDRWGEYDIEVYIGKVVEEFEFSNIVPNANV